MSYREAVTEAALGAWLFKADSARWDIVGAIDDGLTAVESRCVADNYRAAMMRSGHRAILWVSGAVSGRAPRGVWGIGRLTGPAVPDGDGRLVVPTDIALLRPADRLRADDLREIPALSALEVLRMPAGSNPSWVDVEQFAALRDLLPQWPSRRR
ncbi:hypothetical protein [uncultured Williamsia sp.]|uniref:hypothetical protein n=1 Tax=uncultured Williamsia sp. TaxID=259311 RepID=UPI00263320E9|nr:hypothetical protein [uncultured Williamsia sp.]